LYEVDYKLFYKLYMKYCRSNYKCNDFTKQKTKKNKKNFEIISDKFNVKSGFT